MQDIDKFGFNLMALTETENYPWASPEAAVESVMDMSPEEFMITTKNMLLEFEGVEGIGSAIRNAWDWFINLIKRFWNWLSGNDKKEEAMEKKIEKKIDKNNKLLKSGTPKHKSLNSVGTVDDETFKKIDKGMSDRSTILVIGADDTKDGIKFEHKYWAPNESILENIMRAYIDVDTILETLVNEVASVTNWDSFIYKATNVTDIKTLSKVNTKIEETRKYINIIKPEPFYDRKIALDVNDSYKALIKQFKVKRSQIHRNVKTLKKIVEQRLNGGVSSHKKEEIEFQKFITNLVTDVFPKLERTTFKLYKSMDSAYEECINRNEKSDEALNKPQDGSSSYKYDFDEFEEFTLGNESFDIYGFMDGTVGADKYIDAAESYGLKVNIPSITSDIAYEGLEEEYEAIKTILSECDANVNGYADDYTFFGTEGFTDKVKLYAHKAWDAIRRFFYWIASKFSDKYKEKYAIEKVRAEFNSLVSEYSDYMSYDEFHEGYNIGKSAMDSLMKELAALGESQHINLFGITSGLESSEEGKSITVTDYAAMNKAMDQIGEDAKDLAKFTKFLVDMMKNYQASEADFKSCLTPGLKEFPNKLSRIKFPGTKTITPKEAGQFKKEVNEALNNCKQFKAVIDFLNKNKTSVDKYLSHPAIKDHKMTKAIIEAMNRYYIPAVKQITNIIDWYLRCINTDMRKMKDAINSK